MSPNPFLVVGAMKCGTTTLHALLQAHREIQVVGDKESAAFLRRNDGMSTAHRIGASKALAAGEVSTAYMQQPLHEPPVDLVAEALGEHVRIVAILRDPFTRAVSHWQHWRQLGREPKTVLDALLEPGGPYVAFSSYHRQLLPWIERFGVDAVHVLRLEDYRAAPAGTVNALWSFLGLPPVSETDTVSRHENGAGERVVAVGRAGRLARSAFYRHGIRPLLPSSLRRAGATALGGASHRPAPPDAGSDTRERFMTLVDDDLALLRARWTAMSWDVVRQ